MRERARLDRSARRRPLPGDGRTARQRRAAEKVLAIIGTGAAMPFAPAISSLEFFLAALRGWAVPLVVHLFHARPVVLDQLAARDLQRERHLREIGRDVVRFARNLSERQTGR